jgi:lipoprotein NlpD
VRCRRLIPIVFAVGFALLLAGCLTRPAAVSRERAPSSRASDAGTHEVRAGETLYSIAWEAGHDYRQVAAWNGIDAPYLIKPGQKIRLQSPPVAAASASAGQRTVVRGDTLYSIANDVGVRYQDLAQWNDIGPPYVLRPGQELRLAPPSKPARAANGNTTRPGSAPPRASSTDADGTGELRWSWPTDGTVVARFGASGANKGIDISGSPGQAIRAAAPGRVVYQGSGLRGYGQLIIVKHNADFLSAYAHCATINVQEGTVIKAGQTIATMGSTGTDRVKLHFEIRRRGVPVDPMQHLPKK